VAQLNAQAHIVEEWLRLPESRRRHATDAVAFAYRLLREEPELLDGGAELESCHEVVVQWLLPYLSSPARGRLTPLAPTPVTRHRGRTETPIQDLPFSRTPAAPD
jgi:hypothetical protein